MIAVFSGTFTNDANRFLLAVSTLEIINSISIIKRKIGHLSPSLIAGAC